MNRSFDVVALGEAMCEFNRNADGAYEPGFGGDTSNAVIAAARLGARTAYITRVGDDLFGDELLALWAREGVATSQVRRIAGGETGIYFVLHDATGHHFHYRRRGSAASTMAPEDVAPAVIGQTHWLHVSAISQAIGERPAAAVAQAIALAKAAGTRVSYDTNLRLRLWPLEHAREVIAATARGADLIKTSIEDAQLLTGQTAADAVADHYLAAGAAAVVITQGVLGALVATASHRRSLPPHAVAAVDATGAGDAFAGALLAELTRTPGAAWPDSVFAAAAFANAAAALATCGAGAVAPLPSRDAVERLLHGQ
jgi:2-dehydro-3-deoxygluconokinase